METDISTNTYIGEKPARIVSLYRAQQNQTQEQFANALTENLINESLSKMTISHWESGARKPHAMFCLRLGMKYKDWRAEMAFDLLACLIPEAYQPVGRIGRHVLLGEPLNVELEDADGELASLGFDTAGGGTPGTQPARTMTAREVCDGVCHMG